MTDLGVISSRTDSEAQAVNASAEVVGTVYNFSSPPSSLLGFIYLPVDAYSLTAGMNSLGTLGGSQSEAFDINASGQVVGGAQNGSGYWRPFRWQSGTMANLGTLGGETINTDHRAESINASGDVCGRSYTAGGAKRAFFWDGSMVDLGVLTGGTESWAFGLNESQNVVGTSNVTGGAYHAFVWDAVNGMRDLNNLIPGGSGWTLTRATDINDNGSIVGWGTNGSGNVRAFLLTATCKAEGGAAAVLLAAGSGITDEEGIFEEVVVNSTGEPLAEIELVTVEEGSRVDYEIIEPKSDSMSPAQPNTTTLPGFAGGEALARLLKVEITAIAEASILTVSLFFTLDEIAALDTTPAKLALHVLDPLVRDSGGVWVPAGKNIGESSPTTTIGDTGRTTHGDGTIEYWCVRDTGGEFAVGKPIGADDDHPPRPTPRACGAAIVPFFLSCAIALTLLKRRR
jgi:probable HAF family extracellular repeat protein